MFDPAAPGLPGYDPVEVDACLAGVQRELELLARERDEARLEVQRLTAALGAAARALEEAIDGVSVGATASTSGVEVPGRTVLTFHSKRRPRSGG